MKNRHPICKYRSGVAAVELAVCLPVLVVVALITIEVCGMLYVSQSLKVASFEGARVGVVPQAQAENVQFQCDTLLSSRNLESYRVSMSPSDPSLLSEGEYFRVTIEVDYHENAIVGGLLLGERVITRSTALRAD